MECPHCGKKIEMQNFLLHWRSQEKPEPIKGYGIADAIRRAGYGNGAMAALDYWEAIAKNGRI